MSTRNMSPGASILRKSKVFAIPAPLPWKPEINIDGRGQSKTATTPFPIHLSLTTPLSSLSRGDWGLKRRLPLKTTTRTSSPSIRIQGIDTVEQITGFQSSADHAINLQKWQELNLPLTSTALKNDGSSSRRSVFEEDMDNLCHSEDSQVRPEMLIWKFKGPWLAAYNDGEFSEYFHTHVRNRRADFQQILREEYARVKTNELRSAALTGGLEQEALPTVQASDVSNEELSAYIKRLRHSKRELYRIIRMFLDLPQATVSESNPAYAVENLFRLSAQPSDALEQFTHPYAENGPPRSHPSAGLSYLRTTAFTPHHAVYGPQAKKPPVEARVLLPRNVSNSNVRTAVVGCAGFVAGVPFGVESQSALYKRGFKDMHHSLSNVNSQIPGLLFLEPDKNGGSKSWIHPTHAQVDAKGCVQLEWELGDPEAVAVRTNDVENLKNDKKKENFWRSISSQDQNKGRNGWNAPPASKNSHRLSSASEYGLSTLVPARKTPSYREVIEKQEAASELDSLLYDYE